MTCERARLEFDAADAAAHFEACPDCAEFRDFSLGFEAAYRRSTASADRALRRLERPSPPRKPRRLAELAAALLLLLVVPRELPPAAPPAAAIGAVAPAPLLPELADLPIDLWTDVVVRDSAAELPQRLLWVDVEDLGERTRLPLTLSEDGG